MATRLGRQGGTSLFCRRLMARAEKPGAPFFFMMRVFLYMRFWVCVGRTGSSNRTDHPARTYRTVPKDEETAHGMLRDPIWLFYIFSSPSAGTMPFGLCEQHIFPNNALRCVLSISKTILWSRYFLLGHASAGSKPFNVQFSYMQSVLSIYSSSNKPFLSCEIHKIVNR